MADMIANIGARVDNYLDANPNLTQSCRTQFYYRVFIKIRKEVIVTAAHSLSSDTS
jgi:hypothetical protein